MHRRSSKGKRKASPSPSPSSEEDSTPDHHPGPSTKRTRLSSPARVQQAALAKAVKMSNTSSPSKGMAGFAALVNNSNLLAARTETNRGLRPGISSSRSRGGGASAKPRKPKVGKTVLQQSVLLVY